MDKIARIRQEIERRRLHFNKEAEKYQALNNGYSQNCYGARDALRDLENFLDTLEAEERPEPYIPVYDEEYLTEKQRLFKEHHGEVDVDKMLAECRGYDEEKEEPDKSLEEAAENIYKVPFGTRAEDFIAGAEWKEQQMLKEAVEGKIYGYGDGSYELVASWLDLPKGGIYKGGDKVRIVVLKEEE